MLHMHVNSKHLALKVSKAAVPALGLRVYVFLFCQCFCILLVKTLSLVGQQAGTGSIICVCMHVLTRFPYDILPDT